MIVQRLTVKAKQGRTQELADLVSSEVVAQRKRGTVPHPCRICTPNIGQPRDVVMVEWEWPDLATYSDYWPEWSQLPTTPEYWRKWDELAEPDWTNEIWSLRTP